MSGSSGWVLARRLLLPRRRRPPTPAFIFRLFADHGVVGKASNGPFRLLEIERACCPSARARAAELGRILVRTTGRLPGQHGRRRGRLALYHIAGPAPGLLASLIQAVSALSDFIEEYPSARTSSKANLMMRGTAPWCCPTRSSCLKYRRASALAFQLAQALVEPRQVVAQPGGLARQGIEGGVLDHHRLLLAEILGRFSTHPLGGGALPIHHARASPTARWAAMSPTRRDKASSPSQRSLRNTKPGRRQNRRCR